MKRHVISRIILGLTAAAILLPALVLLVWSLAGRWPWPDLLPERWSLRTARELLFGSACLPRLLLSSTLLAALTALLSAAAALLTARAAALYPIPGKGLVRFCGLLPLLIPGTVFAMGIHLTLLRLGLTDTVAGVLVVHVTAAVPYAIAIMEDVTAAVGGGWEEQAAVLGAPPLRAFFSVSLPQLTPGLLASMSMAFTISYSQYFSTLIVGGGRVRTLALVLVPYIQGGDRSLASVYAVAFTAWALAVFFLFECLIRRREKGGEAAWS